ATRAGTDRSGQSVPARASAATRYAAGQDEAGLGDQRRGLFRRQSAQPHALGGLRALRSHRAYLPSGETRSMFRVVTPIGTGPCAPTSLRSLPPLRSPPLPPH